MQLRSIVYLKILLLAAIAASAQDVVFNKLTINNGLSNNSIFSIAQDRKGFMWFGTREGLNRYDGSTILTFHADPRDTTKLAAGHITALEAGDDDLIYIGTAQGVHTYSVSRGTFKRLYYNREKAGYISKMIRTAEGNMLMGGSKGLLMLKKGTEELTQLIPGDIVDIVEFKRNVFLVATLQKMIMINAEGEVLREYTTVRNAAGQSVNLNENIFCLFKDSSGEFWLGCKKDGLFHYNPEHDAFLPVVTRHRSNPLEANAVRVISEDDQKRLWIGTETGLFVYDRLHASFQYYTQSFDQSPATLSDKAIYAICKSREGMMWIGTYFGGVNIVKPLERGFKTLAADGGEEKLSGKAISDIIQDRQGRLWIATEDGGVNIWDRATGALSYINNASGKKGLNINNVHALYEDGNDVIWIGTFLGGVNKYDLKSKTIAVYKKGQQEIASFTNNMVYAIHRDKTGVLWVGTTGGLNTFDVKSGTYQPFKPEVFRGKFVYEIVEERSGALWICVLNSDSLFYYDPAKARLDKYRNYDPDLSPTQGCISMLEDSKGQMWFGTMNRGLLKFDRQANKFKSYTVANGLPNNYVYGLLEDAHGNLWMSTNNGLSKFNVHNETFTNYDRSHGLPNNQFNFKSAFKDRDGWMYFGTINGLCYFHPDSLKINEAAPTIYLSDLKLFNKSVPVGARGMLAHTIDATEAITLNHEDNVITLEFGAINYYAPGNNKYAYYLEGFEPDWNYVEGKSSATYTNLSPGEYIFKVKASNNDGYWSAQPKALRITVRPPFWASAWAFIIYSILVVGLFFAYKWFLNYRNKQKMAVQIERLEKEKMTAINQHKLNFFTYISHEFKTPLTLIIASIDKFLEDRSVSEEQGAGYASIKRSAKRLHALIDQLMEFRRIETEHAQINYVSGDIVRFLRDTFAAFGPLFSSKQIDHYFNTYTTSFHTFFDADKLEKIVTNLLSNAVKYTAKHGVVDMEVMIKVTPGAPSNSITISIQDTGVGMSPDELANIFNVFYQSEQARKSGSGTGIGLALVKSLVDFLKGTIDIKSAPKAGTQILLTLPLPLEVGTEAAMLEGGASGDVVPAPPAVPSPDEPAAIVQAAYQMLIVEDSEDLMEFLGRHFNPHFRISKAGNGIEALEKIKQAAPDIIVSDVMMPEMDGIELCQAVKTDLSTSHIPIVLLTARSTFESRLHGLDAGADAYLPKPFSLKELDLVIKNLLTSRDKLKQHFLKFGSVKDMEVSVTNRDQDFILKLTQIVEKNIDNSEFSITQFAEAAGVSRSLLHLKLKKLVNLSASEFTRHIRLQKAAMLLRRTDLNISEVAYQVGYADSNYFSRSFKEKYKLNPTEYKQSTIEDVKP